MTVSIAERIRENISYFVDFNAKIVDYSKLFRPSLTFFIFSLLLSQPCGRQVQAKIATPGHIPPLPLPPHPTPCEGPVKGEQG